MIITFIVFLSRANEFIDDCKFEDTNNYFLNQEIYYISSIMVSVLTVTTLILNVTKKKPGRKLRALTLIFLILTFSLTILKPNYYRDTYRLVIIANLLLVSLYICNLILINKKEKVKKSCYHHTNSAKR